MNVASAAVAGLYTIWLTAFLVVETGPADYGAWATIVAILSPLLIVDSGLGFVVIRSAARRSAGRTDAAADAETAHALFVVLGAVASVIGLGLAVVPAAILGLTGRAAEATTTTAVVLALDFGVVVGSSALGGLLRGQRRYDAVLVSSLIQSVAGAGLSIALVPSVGLPGAAAAQLVSHVVGRAILLGFVARLAPWFSLRPGRPKPGHARAALRFAAPLIVMSIAAQLSFSTDVLVVGAVAGATAASWIAVGSRLPTLALSLVSIASDVIFPVFVEETTRRPGPPPLLWRSLVAAGFMGGCAFLFLALAREEILDLWLPGFDPLASAVFGIYCVPWAIHLPAHVLTLVLISGSRHRVLAPLVLTEAVGNLALSIALVSVVGPIGAALGSLVAVAFFNGLVLPIVFSRRLAVPLAGVMGAMAGGLLLGGLIAGAGWLVSTLWIGSPFHLAIHTVVTAILGVAGLGILWTRRRPGGSVSVARVST
jgi:O-antigen/teichoic acid export membrane protein